MRTDLRRSLAAAAVLGCGLLAACGGGTEEPPAVPFTLGATEAPVDAPDPADAVLTDVVAPKPVSSPEQPNLLMITMDDASLKDMEFMPHLQELVADQGVTLTNGMAPTPICVPARASLLTGQYANNHGAETISGANGGFQSFKDDRTLPVTLQAAGYDTMFVGKYLNGYEEAAPYQPPGWTTWRGTASTYNFWQPGIVVDGTIDKSRTYSTTAISDVSNDLLDAPAREDRPWYLWVNYVAPHEGSPREDDDPKKGTDGADLGTPAREDRDKGTFKDLGNSDTPDMFEADPSDKGIIAGVRRPNSDERKDNLRNARQQRVESLQSVDRAIERTMDTLRTTGQLDHTYVVVTSDNGFVTGEHNIAGKVWYFRDIIGVPMIVRGPGLPHGTESAAPVTNADWAPTFAALAGTQMPAADGTDVLPFLDSGATRRVVPITAWPVKGGATPLYRGVTVGPWTYVVGKNGRVEMYDTHVDPFQLNNLARDPRFKAQRKELKRLAATYVDCAGAACDAPFMK